MSFSNEEKELIQLSELKNIDNKTYGTPGGNDTKDYVFLLSEEEIRKYLPRANMRKCEITYEASRNYGEWESTLSGECRWWLRTPAAGGQDGMCVRENGNLIQTPEQTLGSSGICAFIRPAMWVTTD